MKIERAMKLGFKLFEDGKWRRPVSQRLKNGRIKNTWQCYLVKSCNECKQKYLASHKTMTYCSSTCQPHFGGNPGWRKGKKFPNERGGIGNKRISSNGYVEIYLPEHPLADTKGRVLEHRLIIFNQLNRQLTFNDVVHHINGIRNDNRPENLILLTRGAHNSEHKPEECRNRKRNSIGRFI